jgi:hypothetical protein
VLQQLGLLLFHFYPELKAAVSPDLKMVKSVKWQISLIKGKLKTVRN